MIYSSGEVLEGLEFWAAEVPDPDGDRAADLFHGLRGLSVEQVTALKMSAQGYTLSQISKEVLQANLPTSAKRLVLRAKRDLRAAMNTREQTRSGDDDEEEHAE